MTIRALEPKVDDSVLEVCEGLLKRAKSGEIVSMAESEDSYREREEQHHKELEFSEWLLSIRGVRSACTRCLGAGVKSYTSTATWRGGIGGRAITSDVCDSCWGSGDSERPWLNLRLNAVERREWENEQCMNHFARVANLNLEAMRAHFAEIAKILEREERKRKTPFDHESNGFFWRITLRGVAKTIMKISGDTCDD